MDNELLVVNGNIPSEVKNELNEVVDGMLESLKNNRQDINRLVFESIAVMTEADTAQSELANKGFLKRLIGGISGDNQRLQNEINKNGAVAQYASQELLKKLGEQNLLSFDLIAAVNNKLNSSLTAVNNEITNIYDGLRKFLNYNRSELVQLESRLDNVERNVDILNWQNSIEYRALNGVEYRELDEASKLLCLAKDFYDLTKGNWNTQDLLLLKSAMASIDMDANKNVNYYNVVKEIATKPELRIHLLGTNKAPRFDDPTYLITMSTISKLDSLKNEESYIVETISDYMGENHIAVDSDNTVDNLTKKYLAENALVDIDRDIKAYDLLVDLLFNLKEVGSNSNNLLGAGQVETTQHVAVDNELGKAMDLFVDCKFEEALPIFKHFAEDGNTIAMYFLSQYPEIDNRLVSVEEGDFWLGLGVSKGGLLCRAVNIDRIILNIDNDSERNRVFDFYYAEFKKIEKLLIERTLANDKLSLFYDYELAKSVSDKELFEYVVDNGYWKAMVTVAELYFRGLDDFEKDYNRAIEYYQKAVDKGYFKALNDIAYIYHIILDDSSKAKPIYEQIYKLGLPEAGEAANRIGLIYDNEEDDNYNAIKWYERSCEKEFENAFSNLALKLIESDPHKGLNLAKKGFKLSDEKDGETANVIGLLYSQVDDNRNATHWFKKSAELGEKFSMYHLARALEYGIGVAKDLEEAIYWYVNAYKHGVEEAKERLAEFKVRKYDEER